MRSWNGSVACFVLTLLSLGWTSHGADDRRARDIVDRIAGLFSSGSSVATVDVQISGEDFQRDLSMHIWSLGEDNFLARINSILKRKRAPPPSE